MEIVFDDRALLLKGRNENVLVVSDIHLGYEAELAERGAEFPVQHHEMLGRLLHLLDIHSVDRLFIIGDVKHTITVDKQHNWSVIPEFMERLASRAATTVIPGNHDGDLEAALPRSVILGDVQGVVLREDDESVGLLHGHAWPSPDVLGARILVIGHSHPTIRRSRRVMAPELGRPELIRSAPVIPVILRARLDKGCIRRSMGLDERTNDSSGTLVILPSFNPLLAGLAINMPQTRLQGPFYDNGCFNLDRAEVYSTQGIFLGTVQSLKRKA